MDDYYDYGDNDEWMRMHRKPATDATRKTSVEQCYSRPVVKELPESIKEPSLEEGASFVQRMAD